MAKKGHVKLATLRHVTTESEAMRIEILALYGFHYKAIAAQIWHRGDRRQVSATEISRIGRVLKRADIRVREYRDGESSEAKALMRSLRKLESASDAKKIRLVG